MFTLGRGGGQVARVPRFYSDDPYSDLQCSLQFCCKIVIEKKENKQKEAGVGPFLIANVDLRKTRDRGNAI